MGRNLARTFAGRPRHGVENPERRGTTVLWIGPEDARGIVLALWGGGSQRLAGEPRQSSAPLEDPQPTGVGLDPPRHEFRELCRLVRPAAPQVVHLHTVGGADTQ